MSLSEIQTTASTLGVLVLLESGEIVLDGPEDVVNDLVPLVREWKPELIKILSGDTIGDVGQCDHCGADLIGLPVSFDGYTNRVCGNCRRWAVCLPPGWSLDDLAEHIAERSAIMQHNGMLSRKDADAEAVQAVRAQIAEQKSIFDAAE